MRRKRHAPEQIIATLATTFAFVLADPAGAQELGGAPDDAAAASDPTARVNFMDFRWRYFDLPGGNLQRVYGMEGATMLTPNFKFVPKLEYFDTNAAGRSESHWSLLSLKGIHLSPGPEVGGIKSRLAVGVEWIKDLGRFTDGTGTGSDQIAPLLGLAWNLSPSTFVITLVQYFKSYTTESAAPDIEILGPRIIFIQKIPQIRGWLKLDNKFSIDYEDDHHTTNLLEVQLGHMLTPRLGLYAEGLFRTGGKEPYDWGVGAALRVMF
ncbi:MAG: hypothetical protein O7B23_04895 [Deltaproteobacteria bacterium]|nr:hypothetical protein [Deltaproteobacteria bacterium]